MADTVKTESMRLESPMIRVAAPLRAQVIEALRQAILDFKFKPGQRLVERELIEMLGVSRTTVREAIRELSSEGLVTVVPQKGAIVSAPSVDEALDLYDVRAMLESLVVERFVERASQSQVIMLDAAVERFAEAGQKESDTLSLLNTKDQIFEVLIDGAGSPALRQLIESVQARVRILRATSMSEQGRFEESVGELRDIVQAVRARDGKLAAERYALHIRKAAESATAHLTKVDNTSNPVA